MTVFLGNIADGRLRTVVSALGTNHCCCFDREPESAGHDIWPPCDALVLARRVLDALDGPEVPLQERFGIQEWADWSDYPDWVDYDGGGKDTLRFETREAAENFILDRVSSDYARNLAQYHLDLPKYEERASQIKAGRALLEAAGLSDAFTAYGRSAPREPKSIEERLKAYRVVRDSEMDSPESE